MITILRTKLALVIMLVCLLNTLNSQSQDYQLDTSSELHWPIPSMPKPEYLKTVVDPVFDTKITRISGDVGTSIPNTNEVWRNIARHGYSVRQPWNADESLIYLEQNKTSGGGWGSSLFLDGQTYQVIGKANVPSSNEKRWHPTNPNLMYLLTNSSIKTWNHVNGQQNTLISFSGYSNTTFGSYTGNFSKDGSKVGVLGTRNSDGKTVAFAVDVSNGKKYNDLDLSGVKVDFITMSPLGNYIVVNADFGTGSDRTKIYDLNGNQVGPFWSEYGRPSHFDVAVDQNGEEFVVGTSKSKPDDGRIIKRRMRDGQVTVLTSGGYGSHASARSINRPGWIITNTSKSTSWLPYLDEIIAVKMDGSRVERITHTRGVWSVYDNQAQACPSPSGSRIMYASDWGSGGVPIQTYVVDFRHKTNGAAKVEANAGQDLDLCKGASVTLTATGGSTYLWSTGAKTASIKVSPSETTTYTVTAYDASGNNSDTDDVIVTVNPLPTVNAGQDVTINTGETITLTASGADSYVWSTGETTPTIKVSPQTTTEYTVVGTKNNCEASDTVTVFSVDASVKANAGQDTEICQGTTTTLTATGGSTYLWSTGATTASIKVSPSETTTYTVTAYDASGNNSDTDDVIVTINPLPTVDAGQDVSVNSGESVTLTATGAETYKWSNGATGASITVNPTATQTYTVIGTSNGCEATDTVTVTVQNSTEVVANAGTDQTICEGTSATLTATGGSTYLWSTGATTASIKVSPSETTTYTVTAYDASGNNSDTDDVIITVSPLPTVDAGKDVSINSGESVTLTATGAETYRWSNGATGASITVNPTAAQTYTVTGTSNGCEATDTVTVTILNSTEVVANAGTDQTICEGTSATLTATGGSTYLWNTGATTASIEVSPSETATFTVTAYDATGNKFDTDDVMVTVNPLPTVHAGKDVSVNSGESVTLTATGAETYTWSNGATGASITVNPTATQTYTVIGTSNGCEATDTVTVTVQNSTEVVANAGTDQTICEGTSATLTATGGSTYLWNTGATTASIEVSPSDTATFTVTAYDATGNKSDTDDVIVTVNPLPTVDAGKDVSVNSGESVTLTATGADTYTWSNGATGASITVNPTATQTYTVTGTSNGCEATDTVTVTILNSTEVVANAGTDQTICVGSSATLTATGGSTYLWSTGATTASIEVSPTETTTYTVTAYNASGKNSDTDDVIVTVNTLPTVDAGNDVSINSGESVTLTATGAESYKWSNGATGASITVNPTVTQTYTVTGTSNGCEATDTVTVNVGSTDKVAVRANAGPDQNICNGSSTILTATGGDTYLWNTGDTTPSISVNPTVTTKYTVTAYKGEAADTDEVIVYVDAKPIVTITNGSEASILKGEFITLSATGAKTYKWSNGATEPNIAVSPKSTTSFEVTGFVNNCVAQKSITVNVFETIVANAGTDVTICKGESTTLTAEGPQNSKFLWSTGETTKSITVDPKKDTEYSVKVYHDLDSDTDNVLVKVVNCKNPNIAIQPTSDEIKEPKELDFTIYPNPTHGDVNIKISGLTNLSSIHLYDLSGKLLYTETINEGNDQNYAKTLNLSDYPSGVYLLQLVDDYRVLTKKIILR
ncbi:T9SS type A sorting domain-containing protein [uncultured Gelidibacter sp.]|uniref:T9SS type A sorting domain-containing protein n=1 Tax=uncultured Gelidibacter sp. TaxID=259318 RepID=UPI00262F81D2|nr:T9SS type A sorting domain-containing protein [uncultured Gelidibacter sp.]